MRVIYTILILFLYQAAFSQDQPGIVSESSDNNGYLASFGNPGNIVGKWLLLGGNKIQTKNKSLSASLPISNLLLNPDGAKVSIGTTNSEAAALTLQSQNDGFDDIHLQGQGRISAQGSVFIQLDDNNTADESFEVLDSNNTSLFRISENGNHMINGTLQLEGRIRSTVTKAHKIHFTEFEVIKDFGDELDNSPYAGSNGGPGFSYIGATLDLPHLSILKKATVFYFDESGPGYMRIHFRSAEHGGGLLGEQNTEILVTDGLIAYEGLQNSSFEFDDVLINYETHKYYFVASSDQWSGQNILSIDIEYTD